MQSKTRSKRSPHRHVSRRQREKPMFTMTLRTSLQTCTRQSRWLIASSLRSNSSSDIPSSLQRSEIWLTQSCVSLPVTLGIHRCEQVAMAGWRPVGPFKVQGRRNRHLAEPVARQGRPVSLPPSWSCGRECPWLSQKVGGIGYAPACKNEWRRGVCPRAAGSKVSCTDCSARSFLPLDYKTLTNHFRGADERLIGEKVSDLTYDRRAGEGRDEWRTTGSSRGHTT